MITILEYAMQAVELFFIGFFVGSGLFWSYEMYDAITSVFEKFKNKD